MIPPQMIRRYAYNQQIGLDVADQEVVLHYVLCLLNEIGITGRLADGGYGPLLFKGGTALRKCLFGSGGRFSQDIDLDAPHRNGFEDKLVDAFADLSPYCGIGLDFTNFRHSSDGNFSGTVDYEHRAGEGSFDLQISYRAHLILEPRELTLVDQEYLHRVEVETPVLYGLDVYEMIGEKLNACNRRQGGSAKDVYDLYLWASKAFDHDLARAVTVLKAWSDRRDAPRFDPEAFLDLIEPRRFRWTDIDGLVPRNEHRRQEEICQRVRDRFSFLAATTPEEAALLADQVAHRRRGLFDAQCVAARQAAGAIRR